MPPLFPFKAGLWNECPATERNATEIAPPLVEVGDGAGDEEVLEPCKDVGGQECEAAVVADGVDGGCCMQLAEVRKGISQTG